MATSTNGNIPALTSSQWSSIQVVQKRAQAFLVAATGAAAKSNVLAFQKTFNDAYPAIKQALVLQGGDPSVPDKLLKGVARIAEDSAWGPQTAVALALLLLISFPPSVRVQAANEIATIPVLSGTSGALPMPRNQIANTWYPKWKEQVASMVWPSFVPAAVPEAPAPSVPVSNNAPPATIPVTQPASSLPVAIPLNEDNPAVVIAPVPTEKSLTWLWVTLGVATVGGGLWWMFGRKKR